jgi:mannose-6-phosphate isomerase-like protein (cupin superfamily)
MKKINVADLKPYKISAHNGVGDISIKFSFEDLKGSGMWNFFAIAELPVGSTVGYHKHVGNDEWYFILEGKALMTVDDESFSVLPGDCVLTQSGSSHGISDVTKTLKFVAVEVKRNGKTK